MTLPGAYAACHAWQSRSPHCDSAVAGAQGLSPAPRQRAGADLEALDGENEPHEPRGGEDESRVQEPWWPQDQLASDMALRLALMVEQLGASALPADWSQVRTQVNHSYQPCPMPHLTSPPRRVPGRALHPEALQCVVACCSQSHALQWPWCGQPYGFPSYAQYWAGILLMS